MTEISLCIPMYRSAAFLTELFGRLRDLRPLPTEIILLDDASPDTSLRLALDFASNPPAGTEVRVLRNEINCGIAAAYNRLAAEARYAWLHILDADDFPVEADFYARIDRCLGSDVDLAITSMDASSSLLKAGNRLLHRAVPARPPRWWPLLGSFATRSGVVYRRERVIEQPFPQPAYPGSDVIHFLTIHNGRNCHYTRHAHVHYRVHEGATSSQTRNYEPYMAQVAQLEFPTQLAMRADLALRRLGQRWARG